jgi:hypothetical protein
MQTVRGAKNLSEPNRLEVHISVTANPNSTWAPLTFTCNVAPTPTVPIAVPSETSVKSKQDVRGSVQDGTLSGRAKVVEMSVRCNIPERSQKQRKSQK